MRLNAILEAMEQTNNSQLASPTASASQLQPTGALSSNDQAIQNTPGNSLQGATSGQAGVVNLNTSSTTIALPAVNTTRIAAVTQNTEPVAKHPAVGAGIFWFGGIVLVVVVGSFLWARAMGKTKEYI